MKLSNLASDIIFGYTALGERTLSTGVRLIGHVPHRAPEAYLHVLFPPLDPTLFEPFSHQPYAEASRHYFPFLEVFNGAMFFSGSIELHGVRTRPLTRIGDDAWQPFDITELNQDERPPNAPLDIFLFGSYNWDGSLLFLDSNGKVFVCQRKDVTPFAEWASLELMISSEIIRLAQFFDERGRLIDKTAPRIPRKK